MTFDDFKKQWLGRRVDYDKVYHYQCTDLVLEYLYACFGINTGVKGNAIDYWNDPSPPLVAHFDRLQTTDVVKGDVVVLFGLPNNPFGHLMIATGNQNGPQFEGLEQNGQTGDGDGGNPDMDPADSVPLNDGNQIRTRWVIKARIAGLYRPKPSTSPLIPAVQPAAAPVNRPAPAGALNAPSGETYVVVKLIPGYYTSGLAAAASHSNSDVPPGLYNVFNKARGMINVTRKPGVPGWWIDPADNVIEQPKPAIAPPPPPTPPDIPKGIPSPEEATRSAYVKPPVVAPPAPAIAPQPLSGYDKFLMFMGRVEALLTKKGG